jgi:hypothetical protein
MTFDEFAIIHSQRFDSHAPDCTVLLTTWMHKLRMKRHDAINISYFKDKTQLNAFGTASRNSSSTPVRTSQTSKMRQRAFLSYLEAARLCSRRAVKRPCNQHFTVCTIRRTSDRVKLLHVCNLRERDARKNAGVVPVHWRVSMLHRALPNTTDACAVNAKWGDSEQKKTQGLARYNGKLGRNRSHRQPNGHNQSIPCRKRYPRTAAFRRYFFVQLQQPTSQPTERLSRCQHPQLVPVMPQKQQLCCPSSTDITYDARVNGCARIYTVQKTGCVGDSPPIGCSQDASQIDGGSIGYCS